MSTLATLNVVLNGDIGGFLKSMKQAEDQSKSSTNIIQRALGGIGDVAKVAAVGAVAAIGAVSSAAIAGVVAFESWGHKLDDIGDVLGTSANESAGLAVAIRRVGGDVDGITTQMAKLSKGLLDVNGKTTPTAKLMQHLGIQFKDAKGQILPAAQVLTNVADKLAAMPDGLEKTAIMTNLFGRTGKDLSDTMNALANGGLKNAEEKAKKLGLAIGEDGVNRSIEFGKSMEDLKMTLEGLAVSVGSVIMPVIQPLIQKFSEWAIDTMPQVRAGLEAVFSWIQTNVGPILDSLIAGIQTVVAWVQNNWPQIQTTIVTTWNNIRALVEPALNAIASFIQSVFGAIATFIQTHGEDIKNFIATTWSQIRGIVEPVVTWFYQTVTSVFGGLAKWINDNQGEIQRIFQGVWDGIKMFVGTVLELIRGIVNAVLALLRGDVKGALDAIGQMFRNIWDGIKDYVGKAVETMRMILLIAWKVISDAATNAWNGIRTWIETAWNNIIDFLKSLPAKLFDLGKQIIEGLWNGIKSMFDNIGKGLSTFFQNTLNDIKNRLGIKSPSEVMAGIGVDLMLGLAQGIERSAQAPRAKWAAATGDLTAEARLNFSTLVGSLATPRPAAMSAEMAGGRLTINNYNTINDTLAARVILEQQRQDTLRSTIEAF
jgi:phage-related protein